MPTIHEFPHGRFSWVDLMTLDPLKAKTFYSGLFGWTFVDLDTDAGKPYTMFRLNELDVAGLGEMPEQMKSQGVPPTWNSYVNVDNIETTVKQAEEFGGKVFMPVMKVMDAGWMAGIQDPTGGHLFLWQKNQHHGAGCVHDLGCFTWNELITPDVEVAKDFFAKLFGWTLEDWHGAPSKYYLIKLGDADFGGIMQMTGEMRGMPPFWLVYFTVSNADSAAASVAELGGQVLKAPFEIPVGRISVVNDDQGTAFCLFEPVEVHT